MSRTDPECHIIRISLDSSNQDAAPTDTPKAHRLATTRSGSATSQPATPHTLGQVPRQHRRASAV